MTFLHYLRCFWGITTREGLRFVNQRERFLSALVRPLVWLVIFAAGFRSVLGISIIEPYETYILYEVYIAPGLIGMIQLFNGMQSSLSMVYDRKWEVCAHYWLAHYQDGFFYYQNYSLE